MSCAERTRLPIRFPLEIRAARTPDAPALVFRGDASLAPPAPGAIVGAGGIARALPRLASGPATGPPVSVSFFELDGVVTAVARGLLAQGVRPGEPVALLLPPGPAHPVLLLALLRAGAVAVPLSTRLPATTIPGLLARLGCRRLITDGGERPVAAGNISVIDAAALCSEDDGHRCASLPLFQRRADATIVFTSGSTGTPKAALHAFENHWASAAGSNRNIPLRPGDRWLASLPPWHVGGLSVVFRCLLGGAAIAVAGHDEPLAAAIPGLGATHVSLVATQLYRLLREQRGRAALRGLKAVLLGGGPAPATLIEEASRAGVRLVTSYGSTEMSSQATATRPGGPPEALRTAGRPLAFRELSTAADGELLVRGRTLFRGYVEGTQVQPARDASGWFHTGDLGHLDAGGLLVVVGRRDTMFISGGENIHPEEIEREILRFPGVLAAIVAPVPDPEFGARPAAFLRTVDGQLPDVANLDRFLRLSLPGFKVPQRYLRWPDVEEGMKPDRCGFAALAREPSAR